MVIKLSRKLFLFAVLTVIWMAVIFFFSSQNGEESSGVSEKLLIFLWTAQAVLFLCRLFPEGKTRRKHPVMSVRIL